MAHIRNKRRENRVAAAVLYASISLKTCPQYLLAATKTLLASTG